MIYVQANKNKLKRLRSVRLGNTMTGSLALGNVKRRKA